MNGITSKTDVLSLKGYSYFDLGLLFKVKGKTNRAREYISKAIQVFEESEAEVYMKEAKEAIESLK